METTLTQLDFPYAGNGGRAPRRRGPRRARHKPGFQYGLYFRNRKPHAKRRDPRRAMKPANTYEALKREWYSKLRDEGFVDIESGEDSDSTVHMLHDHGSRSLIRAGDNMELAQAICYQAQDALENDAYFDDAWEKDVWMLYADRGLPMAEIAAKMGCSVKKVFTRVHRVRQRIAEDGR